MKVNKVKKLISVLALATGIVLFNPSSAYAAWKQDSNGWWNTEGSSYSIGWRNINNTWYYFGYDGYMKTGWTNANGTWYYLNDSGAMKTGWINSNNTWYYLDNSGAMKTGWINDNGTWYYTNESGAMHTGLLTVNSNTYYLNESGAMATGDVTVNGVKYTFSQNGVKISSNQIIDDTNKIEDKTEISEESSTSGGGGGGGNTSADSDTNTEITTYSDLYGKWKISSYISNSGMETSLSSDNIKLLVGEKFTVSKNEIYHTFYSISNPSVAEKTLTNSDFKDKFGINLSNIGVDNDSVKCFTISAKDDKGATKTGYIITDSKNNVYAIAKGAAFKLAKA